METEIVTSTEEGVISSHETQGINSTLDSLTPTVALTDEETHDLQKHEEVIEKGLKTFLEVGAALADIRDRRLYRVDYHSFATYLEEKWSLKKAHAYRLIDAATTYSHLLTNGDDQSALPSCESQLRQLNGLEPEEATEAWRSAKEIAGDQPMSAEIVRKAAAPFKKPAKKKADVKSEAVEIPVEVTLTKGVTLFADDKAQEQMDSALTYLRSAKNLNKTQRDSWKRLLEQVVTALRGIGKPGSNPVE
jgi:hypothetical protein